MANTNLPPSVAMDGLLFIPVRRVELPHGFPVVVMPEDQFWYPAYLAKANVVYVVADPEAVRSKFERGR